MQLDSGIKYLFSQHLLCTSEEPLSTASLNMKIVYNVFARESSRYYSSVWPCAASTTDEWVHINMRAGHANRWQLLLLLSHIFELNVFYWPVNWGVKPGMATYCKGFLHLSLSHSSLSVGLNKPSLFSNWIKPCKGSLHPSLYILWLYLRGLIFNFVRLILQYIHFMLLNPLIHCFEKILLLYLKESAPKMIKIKPNHFLWQPGKC